MTDFALQRKNMVESQIRPSDVTDRRIIRAMQSVAREDFVPDAVRSLAYRDDAVPLHGATAGGATGRSLMSPRTFAKLLVLAEFGAADRVLVVGAGSGYSAAVLAQVGKSVTALESDPVLSAKAKSALTGLAGVEVIEGPLPAGAAAKGPFDVILIEGAVLGRPDALLGQLAEGGRCVGISRETGVGRAVIWRRVGEHFAETDAFEASAGVLPGFTKAPSFTF